MTYFLLIWCWAPENTSCFNIFNDRERGRWINWWGTIVYSDIVGNCNSCGELRGFQWTGVNYTRASEISCEIQLCHKPPHWHETPAIFRKSSGMVYGFGFATLLGVWKWELPKNMPEIKIHNGNNDDLHHWFWGFQISDRVCWPYLISKCPMLYQCLYDLLLPLARSCRTIADQ